MKLHRYALTALFLLRCGSDTLLVYQSSPSDEQASQEQGSSNRRSLAIVESSERNSADTLAGQALTEKAAGLVRAQTQANWEALSLSTHAMRQLDAQGLVEHYPPSPLVSLGYEPREAQFLDKIQDSLLALNEAELSGLSDHGFVVSTRLAFPTFLEGYSAIYAGHLPVYLSADAILEAVHRSYDGLLKDIEERVLQKELRTLLVGMQAAATDAHWTADTQADVDLYLGVALALLNGAEETGNENTAGALSELLGLLKAESGPVKVELFGTLREIDTSQFKPRGHYTTQLTGYFRAMMWLGRIDLRLMETGPDGTLVFQRQQYLAALALHSLVTPELAPHWQRIEDTLQLFVGESDAMTLPQLGQLVEGLGGPSAAQSADNQTAIAEILSGGYGEQRIASHLMTQQTSDDSTPSLPLSRSWAFLGQRYTVDSHVLSEVVFDRLLERPYRMMPQPLDAAFAALGNSNALPLLAEELHTHPGYAGALGAMRHLVDSHEPQFWQSSFYTLWMQSLRALSPAPKAQQAGLPTVAQGEAWGRRILSSQLASWAQLRHDTALYAKQSYTFNPSCDFPDAYVEPYPEFFGALLKYAELGSQLLSQQLGDELPEMASYFDNLRSSVQILQAMAQAQRDGQPHTAEQLEFINDTVEAETKESCIGPEPVSAEGWYSRLFYDPLSALLAEPIIADVHTQPTDAGGQPVGKVLHVGTGYPRLMVVTVDTCLGPRAYTGVASAYHEHTTENFERLTDGLWDNSWVSQGLAEEAPWVNFVATDTDL